MINKNDGSCIEIDFENDDMKEPDFDNYKIVESEVVG